VSAGLQKVRWCAFRGFPSVAKGAAMSDDETMVVVLEALEPNAVAEVRSGGRALPDRFHVFQDVQDGLLSVG
jgi:hypothetical protein